MPFINYYEILEIEPTSDMDVIRKAFNKLAMKYHPDRNIGDASAEIMMIKLNDAIAILSESSLRNDHDERLAEESAKKPSHSTAVKSYNEGIEAAFRKDFEAAINHFTRAIELDSNYAAAYFHRGLAYFNQQKFLEVIADYTTAIEMDAKNGKANRKEIA